MDQDRKPKFVLREVEHKAIITDRVILIPGPLRKSRLYVKYFNSTYPSVLPGGYRADPQRTRCFVRGRPTTDTLCRPRYCAESEAPRGQCVEPTVCQTA